mgnify:CR=1 FL=1
MLKKISHICLIILTVFTALELGTRLTGIRPGYFESLRGFTEVDSLEVKNLFKLDELGIYSINTSLLDSLRKIDPTKHPTFIYQENVMQLYKEFETLVKSIDKIESPLANYRTTFKDSTDIYILETYLNNPINEEGFKSIPFSPIRSEKKKILLLGDSFTYGMSASPSYYSFADLLLSKGYLVYNTGITGTDPAQYEAILKKYMCKIEPDLIILNFCSANDFMTFPRKAKAEEPHEHQTNAGFILSAPLGKYLEVKDCYEFYKKFVSVPKGSFMYPFCKHSSGLSYCYGRLIIDGYIYHPQRTAYFHVRKNISTTQMALNTKPYIDNMNKIAANESIPFLNVIIPVKPESKFSRSNYNEYFIDTKSLAVCFRNYTYHFPKNLEVDDFEQDGTHFNNQGSKKYADFLDSLIIKTLVDK